MATRATAKKSSGAAARARKVRLLLMDVDGVLTSGHIYLQSLPEGTAVEAKAFHSHDGAGLKIARNAGLRTGVITGRKSPAVERRARETGMEFVYQGYAQKIEAYEQIVRDAGVGEAEIAYAGDDLPDLPVMARVGFAVAVRNAAPEVRRAAHFVTERAGGDAAVRELIEFILKAQGKWTAAAKNAPA